MSRSFLLTLIVYWSTFLTINAQHNAKLNVLLKQQLEQALVSGNCTAHLDTDHAIHITKVSIVEEVIQVFITSHHPIDEYSYMLLLESWLPAVHEFDKTDLDIFYLYEKGNYMDLEHIFTKQHSSLPSLPTATNSDKGDNITTPSSNHTNRQNNVLGSLNDKTVWISPGHGWLWNNGLNDYLTQRGNTNGMVEDFGSIENVNQYLQQYLINAGAGVWSVRERDMNTEEVIVDNDAGAPTYVESGNWTTSGSTGYNGGTYRYTSSNNIETASATFKPNIQKSGLYWVSVFYRAGTNRSVDTQYKVNHAGGQTLVSINQEVHGLTWVYLGQFYFDEGTSGSVVLSNETTDASGTHAIIADAVRFGGGVGDVKDCAYSGSPVSNKSRFDESARQFANFQSYPFCENDVVTRPHYAEWELAKGTATEQNHAVYVSLHTNAFNGVARGTETYMFNGNETPNSDVLRDNIHAELINDITAGWDANWLDRGVKEANFGELRELSTLPGTLIELAFHDNVLDANALKEPYFRNLAARSIYKGIVRYFNEVDGSPLDFSPESPDHVMAYNSAENQITVKWKEPPFGGFLGDAATAYKVFMGTHGYAFSEGITTSNTSLTFDNLDPSTTYYFQVRATNDGGISFPSATVAARTPAAGSEVALLIVDGFDRSDRFCSVNVVESAALGSVQRMFVDRMNAYNYMVPHARSLSSCSIPFDGASNESVISGDIQLIDYEGLDWIIGEESTIRRTFNATEQNLLINFLDEGGKLIVSGSEIGWDLGRSDSPNASLSFYQDYLKAVYLGDDSNSYNFQGDSIGVFAGIGGSYDDGSNGFYLADYADRLGAAGGSSVVMNYTTGTGDGAAVAYKGTDFGVVNLGFPIETITDPLIRDVILCAAVNYLDIALPDCPSQLVKDEIPMLDGTYKASDQILSSGLVPTGGTVILQAGQKIILQNGFTVELNGDFTAKIGGCNE